eukprot:ctg_1003.g415
MPAPADGATGTEAKVVVPAVVGQSAPSTGGRGDQAGAPLAHYRLPRVGGSDAHATAGLSGGVLHRARRSLLRVRDAAAGPDAPASARVTADAAVHLATGVAHRAQVFGAAEAPARSRIHPRRRQTGEFPVGAPAGQIDQQRHAQFGDGGGDRRRRGGCGGVATGAYGRGRGSTDGRRRLPRRGARGSGAAASAAHAPISIAFCFVDATAHRSERAAVHDRHGLGVALARGRRDRPTHSVRPAHRPFQRHRALRLAERAPGAFPDAPRRPGVARLHADLFVTRSAAVARVYGRRQEHASVRVQGAPVGERHMPCGARRAAPLSGVHLVGAHASAPGGRRRAAGAAIPPATGDHAPGGGRGGQRRARAHTAGFQLDGHAHRGRRRRRQQREHQRHHWQAQGRRRCARTGQQALAPGRGGRVGTDRARSAPAQDHLSGQPQEPVRRRPARGCAHRGHARCTAARRSLRNRPLQAVQDAPVDDREHVGQHLRLERASDADGAGDALLSGPRSAARLDSQQVGRGFLHHRVFGESEQLGRRGVDHAPQPALQTAELHCELDVSLQMVRGQVGQRLRHHQSVRAGPAVGRAVAGGDEPRLVVQGAGGGVGFRVSEREHPRTLGRGLHGHLDGVRNGHVGVCDEPWPHRRRGAAMHPH